MQCFDDHISTYFNKDTRGGLNQGDPLGLLQDVPWALSKIPQITDYSRDTIIAIMELNWLFASVYQKWAIYVTEGFLWTTFFGKHKGPR